MKYLLVLAGPNGSGKSSIVYKICDLPEFPDYYICPDSIVGQFSHIEDIKERYLHAMDKAKNLRYLAVEKGLSFCFETVFSARDKLDFLRHAKENGYFIELIYITTKDPNINVERVNQRAESGGHTVPPIKVISRYEKSMRLLNEIIKIVDAIEVYDNSSKHPFLVFEKNRSGEMKLFNKGLRDCWVDKYITTPLLKDGFIKDYPDDLSEEETKKYFSEQDNKVIGEAVLDLL